MLKKEGGTGVSPVSSPEIHRRDACAPFEEELPTHGQDAEIIAMQFGKKNARSTKQITEILETLRGLGKL